MPTDTEISTMEIFTEVLKPVVEITEAIGSDCWKAMSFLSQAEWKNIANKVAKNALEIAVMPEQSWPPPEANDQSQSPEDSPPTKKKRKKVWWPY